MKKDLFYNVNTYVNGSDEQNTFLDFDYWDFITLYRLRI